MVSEDSGCLHSMDPAISAAPVHGDSPLPEAPKALCAQVLAPLHRSHDEGEGLELPLFCAQKGVRFEEGDDPGQKVGSLSNHVYQRRVRGTGMIRPNPSAAEPPQDQVKDLTPLGTLTDVELRDELPAGNRRCVPLDCDVERSLPVDETRDVSIQPFLLIGRTCRIVTAHAGRLTTATDAASSAGFSVFPAFGRIYRQQGLLLSHDVLNPARVPL
jgi:hypothetical protein